MLNQYAIRLAVNLTIKEIKEYLHLGRMQVRQGVERVRQRNHRI